jgi:hypothetical protein
MDGAQFNVFMGRVNNAPQVGLLAGDKALRYTG